MGPVCGRNGIAINGLISSESAELREVHKSTSAEGAAEGSQEASAKRAAPRTAANLAVSP